MGKVHIHIEKKKKKRKKIVYKTNETVHFQILRSPYMVDSYWIQLKISGQKKLLIVNNNWYYNEKSAMKSAFISVTLSKT